MEEEYVSAHGDNALSPGVEVIEYYSAAIDRLCL